MAHTFGNIIGICLVKKAANEESRDMASWPGTPTNIGLISCSVMLVCCEREEDEGSENGFEEAKMCYGNVNGWHQNKLEEQLFLSCIAMVPVPWRTCPFFQALPWLCLPMAQLEQQDSVATGCEELLLKQDSVLWSWKMGPGSRWMKIFIFLKCSCFPLLSFIFLEGEKSQ